jgi:transposase
LFRRIAARRGKKRAVVAVGHSILVAIFHMLKARIPYADLGADYLDRIRVKRVTRYYLNKLEALGVKVTVEAAA